MSDERDWRREAIYWRFLAGEAVQDIATAYDVGLEQVELELRIRLRHAELRQPSVAPAATAVVRRTRTRTTRRLATKLATPAKPRPRPALVSRRVGETDWHAKAREALSRGPASAAVSELVTRLRVPDAERQKATTRLWTALQALVKAGEVTRTGTRYSLAVVQ